MYQTIQMSSCVSVHGEFVEALHNGDVIVRDGETVYRGRPIGKATAPRRNHAEVARTVKKVAEFAMTR